MLITIRRRIAAHLRVVHMDPQFAVVHRSPHHFGHIRRAPRDSVVCPENPQPALLVPAALAPLAAPSIIIPVPIAIPVLPNFLYPNLLHPEVAHFNPAAFAHIEFPLFIPPIVRPDV